MIVKGKSRPAAGTLARYIVRKNENERVSVHEVRGTVSQDVDGALREMEAISEGTNCKNFLYHASINPQGHEQLSREQWLRAADILEKELHLEGHQRVLVEHVKDGRAHYHCIWNRIDQDTLKAVHMSGSYAAHERAARQMEKEFGHERVQGVHVEREQGEVPERGPKAWEMERGKRTGVDPRTVGEEIKALWQQSDNAEAFTAALHSHGYVLAKGDRRDFVIIDSNGDPHSLARRAGVKAADIRAKMAGLNPEIIPTVEEAKEVQHRLTAKQEEKAQTESTGRPESSLGLERDRARAAHLGATLYDRADMASMNQDALRDLKERQRIKAEAHRKAHHYERLKVLERQMQEQQQRRQEQEKQNPKAQEARRDPAQEKKAEIAARTEQTDAKQIKSGKDRAREILQQRMSGERGRDDDGRERERER